MSRSEDLPERLLAGEATDFERRLLEGALRKGPAPASSARLAKALGVTLTATGTVPASPALAAKIAPARTAAAHAPATALPWMPVVVAGLVVAAAVVGLHPWRSSSTPREPASPPPVQQPSPASTVAASLEPTPASPAVSPATSAPRARSSPLGDDLRDQIAFIDGARTAVAHDNPGRALEILRRYHDKYPSGSFRPEATAIKVEALVKLRRHAEARALAAQFVAEHRGSLLASKVADLVGLARDATSP